MTPKYEVTQITGVPEDHTGVVSGVQLLFLYIFNTSSSSEDQTHICRLMDNNKTTSVGVMTNNHLMRKADPICEIFCILNIAK
jgi:hypothetical protein